MAFCITLGTHDFRGQLKGYEHVTAQCHNCGNFSARCITEWPFFTICFVPVIPLHYKKYQLVACPVCNFKQDMSARADVQSMGGAPGHGGQPQQQGVPLQNQPHQGPPPGAIPQKGPDQQGVAQYR